MDDIDWAALAISLPVLAVLPGLLRATARLRQFAGGATVFRRSQKPASVLCTMAGA